MNALLYYALYTMLVSKGEVDDEDEDDDDDDGDDDLDKSLLNNAAVMIRLLGLG